MTTLSISVGSEDLALSVSAPWDMVRADAKM
jgi:hypothetical protein